MAPSVPYLLVVSRPTDCCTLQTNLQCFSVIGDAPRNVCLSARALVSQQGAISCSTAECNTPGVCAVPLVEEGEHIVKLSLANGSFLLFRGALVELWHSSTPLPSLPLSDPPPPSDRYRSAAPYLATPCQSAPTCRDFAELSVHHLARASDTEPRACISPRRRVGDAGLRCTASSLRVRGEEAGVAALDIPVGVGALCGERGAVTCLGMSSSVAWASKYSL